MAVLEAMAMKTPVIISEQCHFPDPGPAGAGLVVPLDVAALSAALSAAVSTDWPREAMGNAGSALVKSRFLWSAVAAALESNYKDAITAKN